MSACLDQLDIRTLADASLSESDKRLELLNQDQCAPFYEEARSLELELLAMYRTVVVCTRKEDDLAAVCRWWTVMTEICDVFASRLKSVHGKHPQCGANMFYDQVLDLRNKCRRLAEMHA
ncbi:MAG: hypothetical protein M3Y69_06215 [Verrucomicrobiota bacterium]|nr:hypothetical protein [Verrucomicrobiota bacterium]